MLLDLFDECPVRDLESHEVMVLAATALHHNSGLLNLVYFVESQPRLHHWTELGYLLDSEVSGAHLAILGD